MSDSYAGPYKTTGPQTGVSHYKERALSDRQFELLLEGAASTREYYGDQPLVACLALGRLGLRRAELAHLRADWIDERREMIEIPPHQPCESGRDGAVCGHCRQMAQQRVEFNDGVSMSQALEYQWSPKTEAAAREVYYGYDPRLRLHIERFFGEYDRWHWSANAISRRVTKAAEQAAELDPGRVCPHALRATAATHHAGRGLEMHALMQYFGWSQPSTAEVYLSRSGQNTARQLNSLHQ